MNAIQELSLNKATIDQELCVECGVCQRSGACKADALYIPETPWPRSIRAMFSGGGYSFGRGFRDYSYVTEKATLPRLDFKTILEENIGEGSRGTYEMKTNDITGRFRDDDVGVAVEFGRPGVGFYFRDLEKASMVLAKLGVQFEPENPTTVFLDTKTGKIKSQLNEIRDERALSAIIECKAPGEKIVEIYNALMEIAKQIDTVFTLDIISKCRDGKIILKPTLEKAGIKVRINGKTNMGLGRPLIP